MIPLTRNGIARLLPRAACPPGKHQAPAELVSLAPASARRQRHTVRDTLMGCRSERDAGFITTAHYL